jgi:hypothetical protein
LQSGDTYTDTTSERIIVNREVNVTKRIKTSQGLRYCPVVLSSNGRIKPDAVVVNCTEERHPEGAYYLEWREGTKRIRLSVGKNPATAKKPYNARHSADWSKLHKPTCSVRFLELLGGVGALL